MWQAGFQPLSSPGFSSLSEGLIVARTACADQPDIV
jgi:hypothetical protein